MSKYVEIGYPIYAGMPVYPGLPEVVLDPRERLAKGDHWNGTVLTIYLHAGTHVDAPWHYVGDGATTIDQVPIDMFIYKKPLLVDCTDSGPDGFVTRKHLDACGPALGEADFLIFNTGYHKLRAADFTKYSNNFPAVDPDTAEYIRMNLPKCKAVAIDTLSIENIPQGIANGFRTHHAFLNEEKFKTPHLLIYEDVNPAPLADQKLLSAFTTPLRIVDHDASVVNVVVEVE